MFFNGIMRKKVTKAFLSLLVAPCVMNAQQYEDKQAEEKTVKQEDSADKPQLTISGEASIHANIGDPDYTYFDKNPTEAEKRSKDTGMSRVAIGDHSLVFKGSGKLQNGVKYAVIFDLEAMDGNVEADKMYIQFSHDRWGTLQIGDVKGPEKKCVYSGQQLLGGTCGLDGTLPSEFDFATGVISPLYNVGNTSKATKIAYYSPRVCGFQLGIALTPDTKLHGQTNKDRHAGSASTGNDNGLFTKAGGSQKPSGRNNIALALTHVHEFQNGITTKLSAVYVTESTKRVKTSSYGYVDVSTADESKITGNGVVENEYTKEVKLHNASAFLLSATIDYKKWSIGVGYVDNGKSRTPKNEEELVNKKVVGPGEGVDAGVEAGTTRYYYVGNFLGTGKSNAGKAWNIGAQYRFNDKLTFSGVFHHMKRKVHTNNHTKGNAITIAADYKICDGLMVFAEFNHISTKSCDLACYMYNSCFKDTKERNAIKKQNAQLFVVGAKVSF